MVGSRNTGLRNAQYADALAAFRKAADLNPRAVTPRLYLGTAYMQQFVPGAESPENLAMASFAEDEFAEVLRLEPGNRVAMASVASLYLHQKEGHYSLGVIAMVPMVSGVCRRARTGGPEAPSPRTHRGPSIRAELAARFGRMLEDGIDHLQKALAIDPMGQRADLSDSREEWQGEVSHADEWVTRALETIKRKAEAKGVFPASPERQSRIRVDPRFSPGPLLSMVRPTYSPAAEEAGITGAVRLRFVVGKDGTVRDVQLIGGHPPLAYASIEAVKQMALPPFVAERGSSGNHHGDGTAIRTSGHKTAGARSGGNAGRP